MSSRGSPAPSSQLPAPSSQHCTCLLPRSDTPVRFSQEVIDALQNSNETDSTRAKDLELHIQNRVHAELTRLAEQQDKILRDLSEQISADSPSTPSSTPTASKQPSPPSKTPKWPTVSDPSIFPDPSKPASQQPRSPPSFLSSPQTQPPTSSPSSSSPSNSNTNAKDPTTLSRARVQSSISALQQKLSARQEKEDVANDAGVARAKEGLVRCLRANDRRPLDCWAEVEAFRAEVRRLEGVFLGRVLKGDVGWNEVEGKDR
ncbi:MAG: hypothetical protein LQ340_001143 [Diploschistes diacapsis]|nr:MAG: hypothetical protein LQ340_001143 [Diploschistes diacapsis]